MSDRRIELAEPDPEWPVKFEREKKMLETLLGPDCVRIHHIGSTAIRGIAAKPIIDILVEVRDLSNIDERNSEFADIGYRAKGEHGIPGRRYFQKEEAGRRICHLHLFSSNDPRVKKHLVFRDALNENPILAREYEEVKRAATVQSAGRPGKYQELKSEFIEAMTEQFLKEMNGIEMNRPRD